MILETLSPGNLVYDEKFKRETVVTPEDLMLMTMSENRDRFKALEANPKSIIKVGFKESKSDHHEVRMFDSPRAANGFQVQFGWSNVQLSGALFFFGKNPIPFRFLHEIQNIYTAIAKTPLSTNLNAKPEKAFQL